jgi:16S rRNA (adenine1518-N6/adenine1519-N6)-dimethyltransferase
MGPFSRKRFGQHFLEAAWVAKVIRAIDPQATDRFIEIGPGRGALTRPLLERAESVMAFEIDRALAAELQGLHANLTVVPGDFLDSGSMLVDGGGRPLRVAGNLPYNVASPVLFKLLDLYRADVPFVDATVMLQREVAERVVAGPGGREYGVLSVLVQHTADVEILLRLPPGAFRPVPRVQSALVRLVFREARPKPASPERFVRLVRAIFTRRRKTLANALLAFDDPRVLSAGDALVRSGLDARRRPETFSIADLVRLADAFEPAFSR